MLAFAAMKFTAPTIRLQPSDATRYARLRLRMLTEAPWAFAASPDDDTALDLARIADHLADERNALFAVEAFDSNEGALSQPELIAAAGIMRMNRPKFAHRARVWGVFVDVNYRGKGLGRAIVSAAIEQARNWPGVEYVDLESVRMHPKPRRFLAVKW